MPNGTNVAELGYQTELARVLFARSMCLDSARSHGLRRPAAGGMEIRVRYPVEIENAGEIDDRVAVAEAG
jgi:hypothetical protein